TRSGSPSRRRARSGSKCSPAGRRPCDTGRSTECQEASTASGLRTMAQVVKRAARSGNRAVKAALCLTTRVKPGNGGGSSRILPRSASFRRWPSLPRWLENGLSGTRPFTCWLQALPLQERNASRLYSPRICEELALRLQADRGAWRVRYGDADVEALLRRMRGDGP